MILALAVAIVLGIALGWLIHRASHATRTNQLKHGLIRKNTQLTQAQQEISMLTDDYDDLHRKSQEKIDVLRDENRQIPVLNDNLEKSQLLVRQMMQRHEAQLREVNNENQRLMKKQTKQVQQEQVNTQPAAKLEEHRLDSTRDNTAAADSEATEHKLPQGVSRLHDTEGTIDLSTQETKEFTDTDTTEEIVFDTNASPAITKNTDIHAASVNKSVTSKVAVFAAAESEDDPFDKVIEVGDDFQLEFDDTADATSDHDKTLMHVHDLPLDGSADAAKLFEPVNQHDDLQQIFGIGPLTEKALNELGITSYSQLAELKQHDIQRIADALEIGQSRIERDNWVGNARRQLEEVLEQL